MAGNPEALDGSSNQLMRGNKNNLFRPSFLVPYSIVALMGEHRQMHADEHKDKQTNWVGNSLLEPHLKFKKPPCLLYSEGVLVAIFERQGGGVLKNNEYFREE